MLPRYRTASAINTKPDQNGNALCTHACTSLYLECICLTRLGSVLGAEVVVYGKQGISKKVIV